MLSFIDFCASKLNWLYGRKSGVLVRTTKCKSGNITRQLLLGLSPLFAGVISLIIVTIIVDPYDIRPWGLKPQTADHFYPDAEYQLLFRAAASEPHKLVMIGGSSMMGISNAQLDRAFGNGLDPVNLAYPLALPSNIKERLDILFNNSNLKSLIIFADLSQLSPDDTMHPFVTARQNINSANWANAADFNFDTINASMYRMIFGTYDLPKWKKMKRAEYLSDSTLENDPETVKRLDAAYKNHRSAVLEVRPTPACSKSRFINNALIQAIIQAKKKNITLDIVFPPIPYIAYYDWIDHKFIGHPFPKGPVFAHIIAYKKCVIDAVTKYGDNQIKVIAMDNDRVLGSQLELYLDGLHISKPSGFERVLRNIKSDEYILTPQNFDQYQVELERNILSVSRP